MKKHTYYWIVDDVSFKGQYTIEEDEPGYLPIVTLCTLEVEGIDLMLVIDPRVVQEIEHGLLEQELWNT
jgi:hypothetical protein